MQYMSATVSTVKMLPKKVVFSLWLKRATNSPVLNQFGAHSTTVDPGQRIHRDDQTGQPQGFLSDE